MKPIDILKVFSKKVLNKQGVAFTTYYAYLQGKDDKGQICDITKVVATADKSEMPVSIRVKFPAKAPILDKVNDAIKNGMHFPLYITLNDKRTPDNKPYFFLTMDKDKNGVKRVDKYGEKHYIAIIYDTDSITQAETAHVSIDDVLAFEK